MRRSDEAPLQILVLLLIVFFTSSASAAIKPSFADITSPDFFPIFTWDPQHGWPPTHVSEKNGLETIADCHFNIAGFVLPGDLRRCEKLGVAGIVWPSEPAFTNFNYFREWTGLSDEQINARVQKMVRSAGRSKAVAGFFLCDEPSVTEFPGLAKAVAAVKRYAPGKLAYINLFPDYATLGAPDRSQLGTASYTEYLERFVAEVHPQCLSYDNYMVEESYDFQNHAQAAVYFQNLLEVRRVGQKHNLPYLQIVSSNQVRPEHPIPSPDNLLLQAYTTLAAGCRGVTWYTYYARGYPYAPIGNDGEKTVAWHYLQEVNRQVATLAPIMCKLSSTGVYFTSNSYSASVPTLPGKVIRSISSSTPIMVGEFSGPPLTLGLFRGRGNKSGSQIANRRSQTTSRSQTAPASGTDEGRPPNARYALLVNISLERTTNLSFVPVDSHRVVQRISAENGKASPFDPAKEVLWLSAGQGVLLSFD